MNDVSTDQAPCRNGCVVKGTERNEAPTLMQARHGAYCDRCFSRVRYPLTITPGLAEHIASMIGSHGNGDDAGVFTGKAEAPLPFNMQAFQDVNALYESLVYFTRHFAKRLKLQPPAPASHAWRNAAGHVKGLPANVSPEAARYSAAALATWLNSHLPAIFDLDDSEDIGGLCEAHRTDYTLSARWPTKRLPYYSEMTHWCGQGRIAIYPPDTFGGDPEIVCEGCGRTWSEAAYLEDLGRWTREKLADRRAARVSRFLVRKNTQATETPLRGTERLTLQRHREAELIRTALAAASADVPPAGLIVTHRDGAIAIEVSRTVPAGEVIHRHEAGGGLIDEPHNPIGARS